MNFSVIQNFVFRFLDFRILEGIFFRRFLVNLTRKVRSILSPEGLLTTFESGDQMSKKCADWENDGFDK